MAENEDEITLDLLLFSGFRIFDPEAGPEQL